jgi:polysaccharide pyruvyl transferase WcaK-like protein
VVVLGDVGGEPFHVGDEAMMEANLALLQREAPNARISVLGRRHEARRRCRRRAAALS